MHQAVPAPHERAAGGSTAGTSTAAAPLPGLDSMGLALKAGGVGVWSWEIKSDAVTWMGDLAEIHGIRTQDWSGTFSTFQQVIHPEDQPEVIAAVQKGRRSAKPYHVLYRLAPQDGNEERWIEAMASVIEQSGE